MAHEPKMITKKDSKILRSGCILGINIELSLGIILSCIWKFGYIYEKK